MGPQPSLEVEDAHNLLKAAKTPLQDRFTYLGLYAGLRLSEFCAVDRRLLGGAHHLCARKGGWQHRIPAHARLIERRDEILSMQPEAARARQVQRAYQPWSDPAP